MNTNNLQEVTSLIEIFEKDYHFIFDCKIVPIKCLGVPEDDGWINYNGDVYIKFSR